MIEGMKELLRRIPGVDRLLLEPSVEALQASFPRHLVVQALQSCLEELRSEILEGRLSEEELDRRLEEIQDAVRRRLQDRLSFSLRPVINATGVLLYTNAGRAPLPGSAAARVAEIGSAYSNLEYDLQEGQRGHRDLHFERRMTRLLGCEAATVCNNNAAALVLTLNTLAFNGEVLVSRGELIEIGGSFRLPAIMEKSGARLREVGTTNKTRVSDYQEHCSEQTRLILRVHPSNYRIVGFTESPPLKELAALAGEQGIPLVEDVGSGLLFADDHPCLRREPAVQSSLQDGAHLVLFSGDKLLGGPQAGIIVGRRELIQRIRKNPLMRAFRVDKMTYAALEAVLLEYETGRYRETLPVWRLLCASAEEVARRARRLGPLLQQAGFTVEQVEGFSVTGGGAAPEERIPTCLLAIRSPGQPPHLLEEKLRSRDFPVLARIEQDRLLLDLRTVFPEQEGALIRAFQEIAEASFSRAPRTELPKNR